MSGAPSDNNIMLWNAVIFGPHDTPFEDGTFKLTIEFTEEYPNKPPTVRYGRYTIYFYIYKVIISVCWSDHNSGTPRPICHKF